MKKISIVDTKISNEEIENLVSKKKLAISIYLPTQNKGMSTRENSTRFRNVFREVKNELIDKNYDIFIVNNIFDKLSSMFISKNLGNKYDKSMAILMGDDEVRIIKLPYAVEDQYWVGNYFYLKPLIKILDLNKRYYILSISKQFIKLFEANYYGIKDLDLDLPQEIDKVLWYKGYEDNFFARQYTNQTGRKENSFYYGQNIGTDVQASKLKLFFKHINDKVIGKLHGEKSPLILATYDHYAPFYKDINKYNYLLDEVISGDPENYNLDNLHYLGQEIINKGIEINKKLIIDDYKNLLGTGKAFDNFEEIYNQVVLNRIGTLMINCDKNVWGRIDEKKGKIFVDNRQKINNLDLLDFLACKTISIGGRVHCYKNLPNGKDIIGISRY